MTTIVLLLVSTIINAFIISSPPTIIITSMNTSCIMTTHLIIHIIITHHLCTIPTSSLNLTRTYTIGWLMSLVTRINSCSTLISSTSTSYSTIFAITFHGNIFFDDTTLIFGSHESKIVIMIVPIEETLDRVSSE